MKIKDRQKASAVFVDNIEGNDILTKLLPFLNINKTPAKSEPEKVPHFAQPLSKEKSPGSKPQQHSNEHHITKSSANKIMR